MIGMGVGRHVVQPGPGPDERRARCPRIARPEAGTPVLDQPVVDLFELAPAGARLGHRQPQPVGADAAKMERRLPLDHHRQVEREVGDRPDVRELADERPDRHLDAACGGDSRRPGPAGDDEDVGVQPERVRALQHLHPAPGRAPHELARHACRVGDPVLAADDRAEHVVGTQAANR